MKPPPNRWSVAAGALLLAGLCLSLLLTGMTAGVAAGRNDPAEGLRVMGWTAETSTSECIGNPGTPLCAAETYEACIGWGAPRLCDAAGLPYPHERVLVPSEMTTVNLLLYQITGQRELRAADVPAAKAAGARRWMAGDVALLLQWHTCMPTRQCVDETLPKPGSNLTESCPLVRCKRESGERSDWNIAKPTTYVLRRAGERWTVVEVVYGAVLPAAFWGR